MTIPWRTWGGGFLLLLAAGCSSPEGVKGGDEGRAAAETGVAKGEPCLLFIGLPRIDYSPLDPETGLLRYSMGCVVDDRSMAYMTAHNDATLAALREGRLEGRTFKDRVMTPAAARAPSRAGGGAAIVLDGDGVPAPAGGSLVSLAPRFGKPGETPYVFVVDGAGARRELHYVGGPKARISFAHGGRTLLVRDDVYIVIRTFDLARGLELQVFPDSK